MRIENSTLPILRKDTLDFLRNFARTYSPQALSRIESNTGTFGSKNTACRHNIPLYYLANRTDMGLC